MPTLNTLRHKRQGLLILVLVCTLLLSLTPVYSQDDTSRVLESGLTTTGNLSADVTAESYIFDATAGTTATLILVSSDAVPKGVLLSAPDGSTVAQAVDSGSTGTVQIDTALLPANGQYFVVVYFSPLAGDVTESEYDLTLSLNEIAQPEATPAPTEEPTTAPEATEEATTVTEDVPEQILLAGGIEVSLSWIGAADMNLQVRDPSGETLYWDSRTTNNGGVFGFDANGLCEIIADSPVESATWAPGFLPTGSYEILVFYRQACETTTASIQFDVNVTVDGAEVGTISGALLPPLQNQDSVYLARFVVGGDGGAVLEDGGVYPDSSFNLLPADFDIDTDTPTAITVDRPVIGEITNDEPFTTYSFTGTAGQIVSVDMQALNGNLDTLVQVVDSSGALIGVNDDSSNSTNSFISNLRLISDDTFTIIASRYGKAIGGTEGEFELILTGPSSDVPAELLDLQLPQGDIEVALLWNTTADLQLLVRDPVGESVFDDVTFINSGGILQENGNVNCTSDGSDSPVSYIYWPAGRLRPGTYEVEVWYQNACNDTRPVEFILTAEVAGETIIVERQAPLPDQRYITNFTIDPSGSATPGLAGFLGGSETLPYQQEVAAALSLVSAQPVTGVITPTNTFDVYTFDGVTGESVTLSMAASSQTLDTRLFLISPSGLEIAENDDGNPALLGVAGRTTDSIISEVILPEIGTYTVLATRFGTVYGGTIGGYTLTMRKN